MVFYMYPRTQFVYNIRIAYNLYTQQGVDPGTHAGDSITILPMRGTFENRFSMIDILKNKK